MYNGIGRATGFCVRCVDRVEVKKPDQKANVRISVLPKLRLKIALDIWLG